jgi:hypothetical protein
MRHKKFDPSWSMNHNHMPALNGYSQTPDNYFETLTQFVFFLIIISFLRNDSISYTRNRQTAYGLQRSASQGNAPRVPFLICFKLVHGILNTKGSQHNVEIQFRSAAAKLG